MVEMFSLRSESNKGFNSYGQKA